MRDSARPRLLIVGCGDIGLRVLALVRARWRVLALTSNPARAAPLRTAGALPIVGNLDQPATLGRLAGLASHVLHLAPPPREGRIDPRTRALLAALARGALPGRLVYASTSGVYGDCAGARVDETRPPHPANDRAWRRLDAEDAVRHFGRAHGVAVSVLRVPGIYALDRAGGDPRERLHRATPLLAPDEDVFTNHIHADDLARACVAALVRGAPQRIYHASDDSELRMGEHFDAVADAFGLPRAPRLPRAELARVLTPMQMSFLSESRRLGNRRLARELGVALGYPTPATAWALASRSASTAYQPPMLDVTPAPACSIADAEAALLLRVAEQDAAAFEALYGALSARVYAVARRCVGSEMVAEAATEAAFWRVWREAPRFDPTRSTALAWVLDVALRRALADALGLAR